MLRKSDLSAIAVGAVGELGGGKAVAALTSVGNAVGASILAGCLAHPARKGLGATGEAHGEEDGVQVELHLEKTQLKCI